MFAISPRIRLYTSTITQHLKSWREFRWVVWSLAFPLRHHLQGFRFLRFLKCFPGCLCVIKGQLPRNTFSPTITVVSKKSGVKFLVAGPKDWTHQPGFSIPPSPLHIGNIWKLQAAERASQSALSFVCYTDTAPSFVCYLLPLILESSVYMPLPLPCLHHQCSWKFLSYF